MGSPNETTAADGTGILWRSLADVDTAPAPWSHFPHCPNCHRRLHSMLKGPVPERDENATCRFCGHTLHPEIAG
jgi:hypothetical protein